MLVDKADGINRVPSLYCRKQAPDLPSWIMYDKNVCLSYFTHIRYCWYKKCRLSFINYVIGIQILHFQAYFQQTLHEMRSSAHILRKVDIFFFLEDGTIKVIEPKTENSGLSQGKEELIIKITYHTKKTRT